MSRVRRARARNDVWNFEQSQYLPVSLKTGISLTSDVEIKDLLSERVICLCKGAEPHEPMQVLQKRLSCLPVNEQPLYLSDPPLNQCTTHRECINTVSMMPSNQPPT